MQAPATQAWLHSRYRGIDMPRLNLTGVRQVPVPLPPKDEQNEICRRAAVLLEMSDRLESALVMATVRVSGLSASALAKAFRGEVAP